MKKLVFIAVIGIGGVLVALSHGVFPAFATDTNVIEAPVGDDAKEYDVTKMTDEELDEVRFKTSEWSPGLLNRAKGTPAFLPADLDLGFPPPPKNSSEETKKELVYLQELSKNERTPETMGLIAYEYTGKRPREMFEHVGLIAPENYKTNNLLDVLDAEIMAFTLNKKLFYSRPRPSRLDPTLDLSLPNPPHAAYPSGHSGQTYAVALLLSEMDPDNAELYKQFSRDVAHRREIGGWHYPSDTVAGRQLATTIFNEMMKLQVFKKKFDDAKASYVKPSFDENGKVIAPATQE